MAACPVLLDRSMDTLHDQPQSLCEYAGKVLLVVNTASQCGYKLQYDAKLVSAIEELLTR